MVTRAWLKEHFPLDNVSFVISVSIFSAYAGSYSVTVFICMLSTPLSPSTDYACWVYSLLPMAKSIIKHIITYISANGRIWGQDGA